MNEDNDSIKTAIIQVFGPCISRKVTDSYITSLMASHPFSYSKHQATWDGIIRFIEKLQTDQTAALHGLYQVIPEIWSRFLRPLTTKAMQYVIHAYGYYLSNNQIVNFDPVEGSGCHACQWSKELKSKIYEELLPIDLPEICLCPLSFPISEKYTYPAGKVWHCLSGMYEPIYNTLCYKFCRIYNTMLYSGEKISSLMNELSEDELNECLTIARKIRNLPVRSGIVIV